MFDPVEGRGIPVNSIDRAVDSDVEFGSGIDIDMGVNDRERFRIYRNPC